MPRLVLGFLLPVLVTVSAFAQDLSNLSDFGMVDFVHDSAQINQIGNLNRASIFQSNDFGGSYANYAEINQDGSDNEAVITQSGDQNKARISQAEDSNIANVTQTGFSNSVDIKQAGGGNALYATQTGDDNRIVLTQSGFATAHLVEIGNNNTINATQTSGGHLSVRIEGSGLTVTFQEN